MYHNYKEYVGSHLSSYKDTEIDLLVSGGGAKNSYLMRFEIHYESHMCST